MAIAALVVGIVSCCGVVFVWGGFLGIVALVLGIVALTQVNNEPQAYKPGGKGMAIAGIVVGSLAVLAAVILLAVLLPLIVDYCEENPDVEGCSDILDAWASADDRPLAPLAALASAPLAGRRRPAVIVHGPRRP